MKIDLHGYKQARKNIASTWQHHTQTFISFVKELEVLEDANAL